MKTPKFVLTLICLIASGMAFAEMGLPVAPVSMSTEEASEVKAELPPKGLVPSVVLQLSSGPIFSQYAFVADKSRRTLTIWQNIGGKLEFIEAHPIDYGKMPGDKKVSGDFKTPEGIYFFQKQLHGPELNFDEYGSYAFTLNYPNHFDSLENKTGYGIWLHGIPDNKTLSRGSRGCVVVRNNIIKHVGQYINLEQTPMIVANEVKYVSKEELEKKRLMVQTWLQSWVSSWQSKDLDTYMGYYAEDFKSENFNKKRWHNHKKYLAKKYEFISVSARQPIILSYGSEVVVRFVQDYRSDQHIDIGQKNLYISWNQSSNDFKIKGEEWAALKSELVALLQKDKDKDKNIAQ
ncbi:MAG: L,D-transpeptidase family protein [Bdellovibrionales bacterium]|nr:L,D-transpeptidase family protein [Bdellovibrionales bacterium]